MARLRRAIKNCQPPPTPIPLHKADVPSDRIFMCTVMKAETGAWKPSPYLYKNVGIWFPNPLSR